MSTRAVFTFSDKHGCYHVYKHSDGYPEDALQAIEATFSKSWQLPRFEASEFVAAFIAANKNREGGYYLSDSYKKHGDLDYRYEIGCEEGNLYIIAYQALNFCNQNYKEIFRGKFEEFKLYINVLDKIKECPALEFKSRAL